MQELHKIDKYKDNLLANVSHDLKTPINCVQAFSQNAIDSNDIVEIKALLKKILKNA